MSKDIEDFFDKNISLNETNKLYFREITPEKGDFNDLVHFTSKYEGGHVLFLPNKGYMDWHRWNNSLDYAFDRWKNGTDRSDHYDSSDDIRYVSWGHYPYSNSLMNTLGENVKWDFYKEFIGKEDSVLPCPPPSLVLYTRMTGLLSKEGVLQLRPMVATWWS